ncbi:MAG: AI-2E family transporter [Eubacteriales bacterium]|nr:AI-2E family transporter [Eubacteriales bacterium]
MDNQDTASPASSEKKKQAKKKFLPNNQYFTISVYALVVIACAALIIRVVMTPHAVSNGIRSVVRLLMPFIIGALIAFILNPLINWMIRLLHDRCRLKSIRVCRVLAMVIAYAFVLGLLLTCVLFIVPQIISSITDLINNLPNLTKMTYQFFQDLEKRFPNLDVSTVENAVNDFLPSAIRSLRSVASNFVPAIYTFSVSLVSALLNLLIAFIVSVYMLIDKKRLARHFRLLIYTLVPESYIQITLQILGHCNLIFRSFIVGKSIDSLIIGVLCFIFMNILRMDYALLISVVVGLTNMIPYFGPFIGAIPGLMVLLMVSPVKAFGFLILIFILQQFDGLFLGPKIMGDSVGIKPLWIIVSITIGGSIGGVLGMFLSVPAAAIIGYLIQLFIEYRLKKRKINPDTI